MNSCGQHGLAEIGFHGSSVKADGKVVPAVQVLLGGGIVGDGAGRASERVIKVPTKRADQVLATILTDFKTQSFHAESFHQYYDRQGKDYFYQLLKPFGDLKNLKPDEFVDWGHEEQFKTAIGVGECAGVMIDLVATLLLEAEEKFGLAKNNFKNGNYADAIYQTYSSLINAAKALLLDEGLQCNTQVGIIKDFDKNLVENGKFEFKGTFADLVLQINKNEASESFARKYISEATDFLNQAKLQRVILN